MLKEYRTEDTAEREQRLNKEVMAIAARIHDTRKALELSQNELADFAGISLSTVKRYENGEGDMSIQCLFRIASALNLDFSELATENKYILYKYSLLPQQDRELIQTMIDKCYLAMQAQK